MTAGGATGIPEIPVDTAALRASQRTFLMVSALLFVAGAAGTLLWRGAMSMGAMPMPWMPMPRQTWLGAAATFIGMWITMMVPMMLPSLVPVLWSYRQTIARAGEMRLAQPTMLVATGYFLVWTLVGAIAFPLWVAVSAIGMQGPTVAREVSIAIGVLVLVAGILQFTRRHAHHLACCREIPMHDGASPPGASTAWRQGLSLGVHCSHCCAGLMIILLALGVMDLRVMAVVTIAITAERLVLTGGHRDRWMGAIVGSAGLLFIARAAIPG